MVTHACHLRRQTRRGTAATEFAMFLPVLASFYLGLLWVQGVKYADLHAGELAAARVMQAAAQIHDENDPTKVRFLAEPKNPELQMLVDGFRAGMALWNGAASGSGIADSGEGIPSVTEGVGPVTDHLEYLTHSWESAVFEFPHTESEQPQLTLPQQIRGISPELGDLRAFAALQHF